MWVEAHVERLRSMKLNFALCTLSTTYNTNYETWPTQHDALGRSKLRSCFSPFVNQSSSHAQERLQCAWPCSVRRYLVSFTTFAIKLPSSPKFVRHFDVFRPTNLFLGGVPNFWANFINTNTVECVEIWWRWTDRPQRLATSLKLYHIGNLSIVVQI